MKAKNFLTKEEKADITAEIRAAEKKTSGEIRIHIENRCEEDPKVNALRSFHVLNMEKTAQRNAVLIYVACEERKFAVIGDRGINNVVPKGFWNDVCSLLASCFAEENYAVGLSSAVSLIGEKLMTYFPYQEDDVNELPDEISYGEDADEDE